MTVMESALRQAGIITMQTMIQIREHKGFNNVYKIECKECGTAAYTNSKPLEQRCPRCNSKQLKSTWLTHRDLTKIIDRERKGQFNG